MEGKERNECEDSVAVVWVVGGERAQLLKYKAADALRKPTAIGYYCPAAINKTRPRKVLI